MNPKDFLIIKFLKLINQASAANQYNQSLSNGEKLKLNPAIASACDFILAAGNNKEIFLLQVAQERKLFDLIPGSIVMKKENFQILEKLVVAPVTGKVCSEVTQRNEVQIPLIPQYDDVKLQDTNSLSGFDSEDFGDAEEAISLAHIVDDFHLEEGTDGFIFVDKNTNAAVNSQVNSSRQYPRTNSLFSLSSKMVSAAAADTNEPQPSEYFDKRFLKPLSF